MTYSELQRLANGKNFTLQYVAEHIDMTYRGMKTAIENQTLPIRSVCALCELLGITPNRFFGWEDGGCASQVQNGGIGNMQRIDYSSAAALQEQLRIKDEQLATKDEQIAKLLDMITPTSAK